MTQQCARCAALLLGRMHGHAGILQQQVAVQAEVAFPVTQLGQSGGEFIDLTEAAGRVVRLRAVVVDEHLAVAAVAEQGAAAVTLAEVARRRRTG